MKPHKSLLLAATMAAGANLAYSAALPASQTGNAWYQASEQQIANKQSLAAGRKAKNVILFVGDGMGVSTLTAARILEEQRAGGNGEENLLSFEKFPYTALVKTYNVDAQTPDSAGTMTAMVSGVKTDVGVIGVDEDVVRGDCASVKNNELASALEMAEIRGLATGVISTARITHATPAATYAKSADRNWEDVSDMPQAAIDGGCLDIADQLINFESRLEASYPGVDVDGINVVFGGGRRHFLPKDAAFNTNDAISAVEGDRTDTRDLTSEWQSLYPQGVYIIDQVGFDGLDTESTTNVLGLFNESHMRYEADRANDLAGEPSLQAMTEKAIAILDNDEDGFFLVVESGRIDHGHHAGNAYNALNDTIEFAQAIDAARNATRSDETLILVTADHSHVFTMAGYPKRGNPILGKVVAVGETEPAKAADGMPYTTLGYSNGRGFHDLGTETDADAVYGESVNAGRADLSLTDTTQPGFHQEALIPLSSETHAGEDITLHAIGPGADLVQGVIEQNQIFQLISQALDLMD